MTLEKMWERLTQHQPYADARGYGAAWARMCEARTPDAAEAAAWADAAMTAAMAAAAKAVDRIEKSEGKNND
jgi:hypothetical protein